MAPVTRLEYNLDHQVTRVLRPDGQAIENLYDALTGRLVQTSTPRGFFIPTYHPVSGQVTSVAGPGGEGLAFTYDGSLPKSVSWSGVVAGSIAYDYNSFLEVSESTITAGTGSETIEYATNRDGQLTTVSAGPASTLELTYDPVTGFSTGSTLGVTTDSATYSAFGELASLTSRQGSAVQYAAVFTRDKLGRITEKVETVLGVSSTYLYTYDLAGRLTEVRKDGSVVETSTFDANSNRTSWLDPWGTHAASYDDQDRLLSADGTSYTYTLNGDLATKTAGGQTISTAYDVTGQFLSVALPSGVTVEYALDAANRRIAKKVNGAVTQGYLWSGGRLVAQLDASGNLETTFVYGRKSHVPETMVRAGRTYRLVTDHLGSVRLVVNATDGTVAQRVDYSAFGRVLFDSNPGFQPFGFAGGLYDPQTGLVRFGARDYDPEVGRWTAKDPIGFAGGDTNLYGYVVGDPVNLVDPSGTIVPILLGIWAIGEVALSIYDAYDAIRTLANPCADATDKLLSLGGLLMGAIGPGGGYGKVGKWARKARRAAEKLEDVLPTPQVANAKLQTLVDEPPSRINKPLVVV